MTAADGRVASPPLLLCPNAQALLDAADMTRRTTDEVAATRAEVRAQARAFGGDPEPVATVEEVLAEGVPARLYRPVAGAWDALVWLHGGGWTSGDLDSYDNVARALARRAGCAVLSVDYRLAPEERYPAAIADAWTATRWAAERFERVAVGGDSAGANLAAAVALRARETGLTLALQLLVYPLVDPRLDSPYVEEFVPRYDGFGGRPAFGAMVRSGIRSAWEAYAPDPRSREEIDVAPAFATSLSGVAPAAFVFAEHDILRGEGEAFAGRLEQEGVSVRIARYRAQIHGFFHLLAMDDAQSAVDFAAGSLQSAFAAQS
jgi:acetyl esterase/lipase